MVTVSRGSEFTAFMNELRAENPGKLRDHTKVTVEDPSVVYSDDKVSSVKTSNLNLGSIFASKSHESRFLEQKLHQHGSQPDTWDVFVQMAKAEIVKALQEHMPNTANATEVAKNIIGENLERVMSHPSWNGNAVTFGPLTRLEDVVNDVRSGVISPTSEGVVPLRPLDSSMPEIDDGDGFCPLRVSTGEIES